MMPHPRDRTTRLLLASVALLLVVMGMTLAVIGFTAPGYAGSNAPNVPLQALLQETPTPVPTPVAAACGVRIVEMNIATDTVSIELRNDGAAAAVQALTLAWPVAGGELTEVRLGGQAFWSGAETGGSTTVFPDLAEILPTIKAGEQTSLTLRFSNDPAEGRYIALLHLGNSCYTLFDSNQSTAHTESCFATFDSFQVNEQEATLVVQNTTADPLTFSRLLVFWPDHQAAINSIQLGGGENLIAEPVEISPAEVPLPADAAITLQPEQSVELRLVFNGQAPLVGHTIVLQTDECQSVFSNAESPSACPVRQEGNIVVNGPAVGLALQNLGETDQPIKGIWLTFPEANEALVDVILDDSSIIVDQSSGRFPKTSSPATMTAGVDLLSDASLAPNSQSALSFVFSQDASPEHYTVEVDLPNECRVLATTRTEDPVPCQMQVGSDTPIRTAGNSLWLTVHNAGEVAAELRAVQVDWADQFNGALTEVALGDVPFWQGRRVGGTATVTHNTEGDVAVVEPGQSMELRLTFANRIVESPYVFRLDFAEDCRLSYATQSGLAMPTPVEFRGIIHRLPEDAFDGVWEIELFTGEVLSMQVTPQTLIEPSELTPRTGDVVRAQALPAGDQYLATHIRVTAYVVGQIQLTGVIEEVGPEREYITVQSAYVDITPDTDIQGELEVGWLADIGGYQRVDGSVLARSISTTEPEVTVMPVDFQGLVEGWTSDDPSLSEDETLWYISGLHVIVHRVNTIHHGIEPGQPPEKGVEVQVTGDLISARTVRARELWYGPNANVQEFNGIIEVLPDHPQFYGEWTIRDSADGVSKAVLVTESTFLDISEAMPAVGAAVQVRSRRNNPDGNLEALWIKVLVED